LKDKLPEKTTTPSVAVAIHNNIPTTQTQPPPSPSTTSLPPSSPPPQNPSLTPTVYPIIEIK
jgi:hypothetical protein